MVIKTLTKQKSFIIKTL